MLDRTCQIRINPSPLESILPFQLATLFRISYTNGSNIRPNNLLGIIGAPRYVNGKEPSTKPINRKRPLLLAVFSRDEKYKVDFV